MEIKTYRAKTMQQALDLVRSELGPAATVLHTRELNASVLQRFFRGREYEIAATPGSTAAAELASSPQAQKAQQPQPGYQAPSSFAPAIPPNGEPLSVPNERLPNVDRGVSLDFSNEFRQQLGQGTLPPAEAPPGDPTAELQALVSQFRQPTIAPTQANLPPTTTTPTDISAGELPADFFHLFTDLIEADMPEATARELVDQVRKEADPNNSSPLALRARVCQLVEEQLATSGPLAVPPADTPTGNSRGAHVVALIGPTGVGKTTTIAKLAANYRLIENRRVALVTVDTYRIAAVEQLRTYAEIIDIPMQVVASEHEIQNAIEEFKDYDLILLDTAGRSPRDDLRIDELSRLIAAAQPDEVHLVLSAVGSARSLTATAGRFAPVGVTQLLITKLDEMQALGHLFTLARETNFPLSYLTNGQNVPDDIRIATRHDLAQAMLNINVA